MHRSRADQIWTGGGKFANIFSVAWLKVADLPFSECSHLKNPLNDNLPVKIGRDGQEVFLVFLKCCQVLSSVKIIYLSPINLIVWFVSTGS